MSLAGWGDPVRSGPAQFLEAVLAATSQGVALVGPAGEALRVNRAAEAILGLPGDQLAKALSPGDRAALFRPERLDGTPLPLMEMPTWLALQGERPRGLELRLHRPDGTVVRILASAAPVPGPDGTVAGAIITFSDVTAERSAEEKLRASEEEARGRAAMLEAVLDTIADGVIIYDSEGRTLRSSPSADSILGIPEDQRREPLAERLGRQYEVRDENGTLLRPDDMVAVRAAVHGEAVTGAMYSVRTGDAPPRWLNFSGKPLTVAGRHAGGVVSFTDLTRNKQAELELAAVTRLYAVLSRVNETIVRVRDAQALYERVCRIIVQEGGFPLAWVGRIQGRRLAPVAHWGPAAAYLDELRVEIDGEMGQGPAGTAFREDRTVVEGGFGTAPAPRPWRAAALRHGLRAAAAFPIRQGGRPVGAFIVYAASRGFFTPRQVALLESLAADLSFAVDALEQERLRASAEQELHRANVSLRNADRRKDEFLGMLSHELRNPLAPILNAARILAKADPGGPQALSARAILDRQVTHMARLVDDLLDVTRIARGRIEVRRERCDLTALVARAAEDFRALLADPAVAFRLELPARPLWAEVDPVRISQVIGNLLHNAAKFTGPGGTVTLELAGTGAGAEIRVRDTGVGIDPALMADLFEPFVQGQRSMARGEGGLGLGLALVKAIAELHGGSVAARSPGSGRGAEFTVRLPLAEPEPAGPGSAQARVQEGPAQAGRRRVLVVDDNRDAADSLAMLLRLGGFRTAVAYDGPGALDAVRADPPDFVLCDLGMPGMDGFQVAREIRAGGAAGPRLVALSGYAQPEDVARALAAGFDAHLAKPPDPDALARQLAE
jgi:PAS domain S-box-containing protein